MIIAVYESRFTDSWQLYESTHFTDGAALRFRNQALVWSRLPMNPMRTCEDAMFIRLSLSMQSSSLRSQALHLWIAGTGTCPGRHWFGRLRYLKGFPDTHYQRVCRSWHKHKAVCFICKPRNYQMMMPYWGPRRIWSDRSNFSADPEACLIRWWQCMMLRETISTTIFASTFLFGSGGQVRSVLRQWIGIIFCWISVGS